MSKNQIFKIIFIALKILYKTIKGILLTYAIAFSIVGTIAIVYAVRYVMKPLQEVQALKTQNPDETAYMKRYKTTLTSKGLSDTLVHRFIPFDSISPFLKTAVLAAEDDGFYVHPGFDIEAIMSAYEYNKYRGKVKRGASTITQQLAKNLFLDNSRNFERKFKELAYTLLMEHYLGKERIFELYLNYAQWGKNIFGCEAAAQAFYKKSAHDLNRTESTRMAAVLCMPTKMCPTNYQSSFLSRRIVAIANNLYRHGAIDDSGFLKLTGFVPPWKVDSTSKDSALIPVSEDSTSTNEHNE